MLSKRRLIKWKIYLDRSKGYVGTIQLLLTGVIFLNTLPGTVGAFFKEHALIMIPLGFALALVITLLIGWLDTVMGLREEELRNTFRADPVHMEMLEILKKIK